MEQKRARIKYYPEYYIRDSVKTVNGYAIELWDNTQNNWELCLFVQFMNWNGKYSEKIFSFCS